MTKGRVLVTGGAGFIGSHIVDELLAQGYDTYVVDNLSTGRRDNLPPAVPLYEVDIRDGDRLATVFSEVQPRFVCHQAAQVSVSRSVREPLFDADQNISGWLRVLEECVRLGVERVVFASSGGALYGDVFEAVDESHPVRPISPYGISKWVGEEYLRFYAREHGIKGIALRYANVYGPRQNPDGEAGVVAIFAHRMLMGEPVTIYGDGRNVRDYVFVGDVADANVLALEAPLGEQYTAINVSTGSGVDVNALEARIRALAQEARTQTVVGGPIPPPRYAGKRAGDLRSSLLSPGRARLSLGWNPRVDLEQGLRATVDRSVEDIAPRLNRLAAG